MRQRTIEGGTLAGIYPRVHGKPYPFCGAERERKSVMEETANLKLPFILPSQAQKHVTHNESLQLLDAIVQLGVLDRDLTAPPAEPAEGDRYIIASPATGAWEGREGEIAAFQDGAWNFLSPRPGWRAWIVDEQALLVWDGSSWIDILKQIQHVELLGIGTEADAQNVFAAKLNKALWAARIEAEGGDGNLRYTLNKEGPQKVLSLLMQSGWSGRAEVGLAGSDDLSIRVSPDGSQWHEALHVDRESGIVSTQALPRFKAYTNYDNYVGVGVWTKIGINNADYNEQGCFDAGTNRFIAPVDGTYLFGASLLYKINYSADARMSARLVLNGATEVKGSRGEISGPHESLLTALCLSTLVTLEKDDAVELQGCFRGADGYFAADGTTFWGLKVG